MTACIFFNPRTMVSFGVYNAGASSADSFASTKAQPKFRGRLVEHVQQMEESGVSLVFVQELHPEVHIFLPRGWRQVHEKSAKGNNLRVWFKKSQLEFLGSTQEQVLTSRDDEAHHWRTWQKVWFLHRESQRVTLGANVHTTDGQTKHRIRGSARTRLKFKSRCLQAILEQVVASMWRPDFSSPSHGAGQSGQPCSFIMGGDFNLTREPFKLVLPEAVVSEECLLSAHVTGTMAGVTNLTSMQLVMRPKIVGPDNGHEAVVVRAELGARSCVVLKPCSTSTSQAASKIADSVQQAALATRGDEQAQKKRRMEQAASSSGDGQASPSHDAGQDDDDKQAARQVAHEAAQEAAQADHEAAQEAARQAALQELAARQAALDAQKKAAEEEQQRQAEEVARQAAQQELAARQAVVGAQKKAAAEAEQRRIEEEQRRIEEEQRRIEEEQRQEAEQRRQEEEEEADNYRLNLGGGPFRRQGLPCNVVVDRRGDLFIHVGRRATTQAISELLELRVPLLRKMHATVVETPLSKDDTKAVMKQLRGKWADSPEAKTWVDEAWRCSYLGVASNEGFQDQCSRIQD